jgi:regulatory protein
VIMPKSPALLNSCESWPNARQIRGHDAEAPLRCVSCGNHYGEWAWCCGDVRSSYEPEAVGRGVIAARSLHAMRAVAAAVGSPGSGSAAEQRPRDLRVAMWSGALVGVDPAPPTSASRGWATMFHVKHPRAERPREWTESSLYAYGLRLLTYRARAEREVRQRFQQRSAPPDLIDAVVERLRAGGLVDDEAFAEAWIESRRRASPRGDRLLKRELSQKGVQRNVAESALSGESDERGLALAAGAKKARALTAETEPVFVRRLTDFLLRRGFGYDVTAEVVRELVAEREPPNNARE